MGYRPRSDLIYGVTGPDLKPDFKHFDNDDSLLALYDIARPNYDDLPDGVTFHDALQVAVAAVPITVDYWGCDGSEQLFYGVRASRQSADWDGPLSIGQDALTPGPEWDRLIADFEARAGLPAGRPGWLLLSSYG